MPGSIEPWLERTFPGAERAPVLLEALPWPALRRLLDEGHDLLLLPVGATEQHGPHLPVNTDTLIARSACRAASALTGVPVLPEISYGVSLGHTEKWPGTFSLMHETLMASVGEVARWAAATGWRRLLIINAHFGNDAPLRCTVDRIRFDLAHSFHAAVRNIWSLTSGIQAQFTSDAADWHANDAETSLLLHLAPDLVGTCEDDPDRTGGCVFPHMVANTSLNGVTGLPTRASKEKGAALFRQIVEALAGLIRTARSECPPLEWRRVSTPFAT
jgi:creatinine amidohydrolase